MFNGRGWSVAHEESIGMGSSTAIQTMVPRLQAGHKEGESVGDAEGSEQVEGASGAEGGD